MHLVCTLLSLVNLFLPIEEFWVFLSFLSDRSVFVPSDACAESTAIAGKIKEKSEDLSLMSKEKVGQKDMAANVLASAFHEQQHHRIISLA